VSTGLAGPVSAPVHSLSPSGKPSHLGLSRRIRVCGSFSCGGLCPELGFSHRIDVSPSIRTSSQLLTFRQELATFRFNGKQSEESVESGQKKKR